MSQKLVNGIVADYRPLILNPQSKPDLDTISALKSNPATMVRDTLEAQVGELIKISNPARVFPVPELRQNIADFLREHKNYGIWVYYPWRNTLVKILDKDDFIRVRTSRNRYKITQEEQDLLAQKKVGVIGLSVGQSVSLSLAMERSFGELRIADFDTLDLSNMNRIRTGLYNLGLPKAWMVAREIAEIDPFLNVTVFDQGITNENMDEFFTFGGNLDLLVEECDSLKIKISSRLKAKKLGIPVLMDTSDRGLMDIERFDMEPNRPIFHGLLEKFGKESELDNVLQDRSREILFSILDFEDLSERLQRSMGEIGKTITTWPQTASSVISGGAAAAYYSRLILLDQDVISKRFYIDLDLLNK